MTRSRIGERFLGACLLSSALLCATSTASADEHPSEPEVSGSGIGVGIGFARFDTTIKFTEKQSGDKIFVDATGTLGLPDTGEVPVFYVAYRFSAKHAQLCAYPVRGQ
jgi:hypothetical protein